MMFRIKSYHAGCHVIQQRYFGCLWFDRDSFGLYETYDKAMANLGFHMDRLRKYPKFGPTFKL